MIRLIPAEYLDNLLIADTYMINDSIPNIITFLQTNFCRMADQEMSDKEDELKSITYDPQQPVYIAFNKVKLFQDLCTLMDNEKNDRQLVQLSYLNLQHE